MLEPILGQQNRSSDNLTIARVRLSVSESQTWANLTSYKVTYCTLHHGAQYPTQISQNKYFYKQVYLAALTIRCVSQPALDHVH